VFLYLKGGIIIELEELEIIVTAKIEEAVREVMKLAPQIKQTMKQVQESFSKVDMKEFNKKVQQSMENLKRILKKNSNNEVKIKANNEELKKKVSQARKELDSLKKQTTARKF